MTVFLALQWFSKREAAEAFKLTGNYTGYQIIGVFSTEEKAQMSIDICRRLRPTCSYDIEAFSINKFVDEALNCFDINDYAPLLNKKCDYLDCLGVGQTVEEAFDTNQV